MTDSILAQGTLVGSYEIIQPIARGGMGTLYLARHREQGHLAAVKVLREPGHGQRRVAAARFVKEARAVAAIQHPNVVNLYEAGATDSGELYMAMEYLEGLTLRARLKRDTRLPVGEALYIGERIAAALSAAHGWGIVHRDLKPSNVMLLPTRSGYLPTIKLLDFGIAKFIETGLDDTTLTHTGVLLGTPRYMSPEQCRGTGDVDHRTDIYSLGILLYIMLTGTHPFVDDKIGVGEIIARHLSATPAALRTHNPDIPPSIDQIVLRCLHKNPGERFENADELGTALAAEREDKSAWDCPVAANLSTPISGPTYPRADDLQALRAAIPKRRRRLPRRATLGSASLVLLLYFGMTALHSENTGNSHAVTPASVITVTPQPIVVPSAPAMAEAPATPGAAPNVPANVADKPATPVAAPPTSAEVEPPAKAAPASRAHKSKHQSKRARRRRAAKRRSAGKSRKPSLSSTTNASGRSHRAPKKSANGSDLKKKRAEFEKIVF